LVKSDLGAVTVVFCWLLGTSLYSRFCKLVFTPWPCEAPDVAMVAVVGPVDPCCGLLFHCVLPSLTEGLELPVVVVLVPVAGVALFGSGVLLFCSAEEELLFGEKVPCGR
jgi:hypothetical protein